MTRVPAKTVNKLHAKDVFRLTNLVAAEYVSSKLSDVAFAIVATEKLGVEVNKNNVASARETLELKSNRDVLRELKKQPTTRLSKIELDIDIIKTRFNELLSELGKLPL
jgi:hypothetical protein